MIYKHFKLLIILQCNLFIISIFILYFKQLLQIFINKITQVNVCQNLCVYLQRVCKQVSR